MSVEKVILRAGNDIDMPQTGDKVRIAYTGWLYNSDQAGKGKKFDNREKFEIEVGKGKLIKEHAPWEESIIGMSLGEKSKLTIPPELAYGDRSFPGYIPVNATLIFEVELQGINGKTMDPEVGVENSLVSRSGSQQRVPDLYD